MRHVAITISEFTTLASRILWRTQAHSRGNHGSRNLQIFEGPLDVVECHGDPLMDLSWLNRQRFGDREDGFFAFELPPIDGRSRLAREVRQSLTFLIVYHVFFEYPHDAIEFSNADSLLRISRAFGCFTRKLPAAR